MMNHFHHMTTFWKLFSLEFARVWCVCVCGVCVCVCVLCEYWYNQLSFCTVCSGCCGDGCWFSVFGSVCPVAVFTLNSQLLRVPVKVDCACATKVHVFPVLDVLITDRSLLGFSLSNCFHWWTTSIAVFCVCDQQADSTENPTLPGGANTIPLCCHQSEVNTTSMNIFYSESRCSQLDCKDVYQ